MQYFGIDWLAMVLTLWAVWDIGNKKKSGFILMIIANICWVVLGYLTESLAMALSNLILMCLNVRAIVKWSK